MFWENGNCTVGKKRAVEIESPVLLAVKHQFRPSDAEYSDHVR